MEFWLEENIDKNKDFLDIARILILISTFKPRSRDDTIKSDPCIKGITKLAKLDFLIRYPLYLQRALKVKNQKENLKLKWYEKSSVESKMIRYRYGPWDHNYYKLLRILKTAGLITIEKSKKTIMIDITKKGLEIVAKFKDSKNFQEYFERGYVLRKNFNIGATNLKNFIYETFPEITSLHYGDEIKYE